MPYIYQTPCALHEQISRFEPNVDNMLKRMLDAPEVVIIIPPSAGQETRRRAGLIESYALVFKKPVKKFGYSSEASIYTSNRQPKPFVYAARTDQPELLEHMEILADTGNTVLLYPPCDEAYAMQMYLVSKNHLTRHVLVLEKNDSVASKSPEVEIFDAPYTFSLLRGSEKNAAEKNLGRIRLVRALKRRPRML